LGGSRDALVHSVNHQYDDEDYDEPIWDWAVQLRDLLLGFLTRVDLQRIKGGFGGKAWTYGGSVESAHRVGWCPSLTNRRGTTSLILFLDTRR